ncbi:MAG TPA: hypothetical protein ENK50_08295 [Sedimenticola sp.]|nr:hypothetical protein [Sedimenticola sp.]
MSDRDDLIRRLNPEPPGRDPAPGPAFPVDDEGIPILEEVVSPGQPTGADDGPPPLPGETTAEAASQKEALLAALEQELGHLPPILAERVAAALRPVLEEEVRRQLRTVLEERLEALLGTLPK